VAIEEDVHGNPEAESCRATKHQEGRFGGEEEANRRQIAQEDPDRSRQAGGEGRQAQGAIAGTVAKRKVRIAGS
jgi:hypothetical protein